MLDSGGAVLGSTTVLVPLARSSPAAHGHGHGHGHGRAPRHAANEPRDCGTGADPGCSMRRHGRLPMDAAAFHGLMSALNAHALDAQKVATFAPIAGAQYLTAAQLGRVLDTIVMDDAKLQIARAAAPHVVNPMHALSLANEFVMSSNQSAFTQLMGTQR
jgi:hypothetical protein